MTVWIVHVNVPVEKVDVMINTLDDLPDPFRDITARTAVVHVGVHVSEELLDKYRFVITNRDDVLDTTTVKYLRVNRFMQSLHLHTSLSTDIRSDRGIAHFVLYPSHNSTLVEHSVCGDMHISKLFMADGHLIRVDGNITIDRFKPTEHSRLQVDNYWSTIVVNHVLHLTVSLQGSGIRVNDVPLIFSKETSRQWLQDNGIGCTMSDLHTLSCPSLNDYMAYRTPSKR